MNISLKHKIITFISKIPKYIPKCLQFKFSSKIYSYINKIVYSSIKKDVLVRTPLGIYIYVNYSDWVERTIATGIYEEKYVDFFLSKIKEGDIIIDIGSYIGYFSLLASQKVGIKGHIYAFEPIPRNYRRLMRNIDINHIKNIKAYNLGVSDKNENTFFNMPIDIPAESSLYNIHVTELKTDILIKKELIDVRLILFDQFSINEGIRNINIIKIDTEGAELKVLEGMKKTLKNNDITLFIEILPFLIEKIGYSVEDIINLLLKCNFNYIYTTYSRSKINKMKMTSENISDIIEFINLDKEYNFIFTKE